MKKILCKPILKNEIDKYLNNGWSLCRVVAKKEKIKRELLKKKEFVKYAVNIIIIFHIQKQQK